MSYHDHEGDWQAAVTPVLRVLSQLGGYFTFADARGEQFVIASKSEFEKRRGGADSSQRQLPLSSARWRDEQPESADEVLETINREIAEYHMKQEDELEDDLALTEEDSEPRLVEDKNEPQEYTQPLPPPVRVKFEPLRGDLPPELQE